MAAVSSIGEYGMPHSMIEVAKIVRPQGLRGELRLQALTRNPQDLARYRLFYMTEELSAVVEFSVENIRWARQCAIVKLVGVNDRTSAEKLRDKFLYVRENQLPIPAVGEYFIKDLLGLHVVNEQGDLVGILEDILELPANDVYQVHQGLKELLIPAISSVVLNISLKDRTIVVRLPEGLADSE